MPLRHFVGKLGKTMSEKIFGCEKHTKKYLLAAFLLLCGAAFLLTGCGGHTKALAVTDGKLTDMKGRPVQLRGVSTHGIAWFPQYVNMEGVASLKEAGANVFRLAMYTDTENGYLADPEGNLALIRQGIEAAKEADMYVIIDWHILSDGDPLAHVEEAEGFFETISSEYGNDPLIIYEICNEPNNTSWDNIKAYADRVIPVIRENAPDAVVIVGTPNYSSGIEYPMLDPLDQENILYAYHFYAGEHLGYGSVIAALEQGLPVFVSEWGIGESMGRDAALSAAKDFAGWMNANDVSWCAWSLCNKEEPYSLISPSCSLTSGWSKDDLSDAGKVVFSML